MPNALSSSKVTARPRVNFVKGSEDDAACPTDKETCQKKAFLVPGDVVLTGHAQGVFTCVAYQPFHTRKHNGVAADVIRHARRTDVVAKNSGLGRLMVSSRWNNLGFAWQERDVKHRR